MSSTTIIGTDITRKAWNITMGYIEDFPVPRTRRGLRTQVSERYHRRRDELGQAIGEIFIGKVSMVGVGKAGEILVGTKLSESMVSRMFHTLKAEYTSGRHSHRTSTICTPLLMALTLR